MLITLAMRSDRVPPGAIINLPLNCMCAGLATPPFAPPAPAPAAAAAPAPAAAVPIAAGAVAVPAAAVAPPAAAAAPPAAAAPAPLTALAIRAHATRHQDWLWHMTSGQCRGDANNVVPNRSFSWPKDVLSTARHLGWTRSWIGFEMMPVNALKVTFRNLAATSLFSQPLTGAHGLPRNLPAPSNNMYKLALVSLRCPCVPASAFLRFGRSVMSAFGAFVSIVPVANTLVAPVVSFMDLGLHYIAWDPVNACWRDPHAPWQRRPMTRYVDTGIRVALA